MPAPLARLVPLALGLALLSPASAAAQAASPPAPPVAVPEPRFRVERLAQGVYAVIRQEPTGLWFESNNVFIVGDHDVLVVDANFSRAETRRVIEAIRAATPLPVRYVVNTHWHDDHVTGNAEYRDAFPGVEFIAHASATADMAGVGADNRRQSLEAGPAFAARLRELVAAGRGLAGGPLDDEERDGYLATVGLIDRFTAEAPGAETVLPTLTVERGLALRRGGRVIEIRSLGGGHTRSDLVVHLPDEGIVAAGDLVVWPVPLVGSTSHPASYAAALGELIALRPRILVPGHGPVQRDDGYLRAVAALLASVAEQTAAAVSRGETLDQARRSVDLERFRRELVGDSPLLALLFQEYVVSSAVAAAWREAGGRE